MEVRIQMGSAVRFVVCAVVAGGVGVFLGGGLGAGPLNPPAGAVTGTYKTLTEVEPRTLINAANTPGDGDSVFRITVAGSYYLGGNVTGVVGKSGIEIAASGVTVDLRGFLVQGVAGSLDGIVTAGGASGRVSVVDGHVRGWGQDGVDLSTTGDGSVINVQSSENIGSGVRVGSATGVVTCSASGNGVAGILTGSGCSIRDCSTSSNGTGISVGSGSTVIGSSCYFNSGNGIQGGFGCVVSTCSVTFSGGDGISVSIGATVTDNSLQSSALNGIKATYGSIIRGNTCRQSGSGAGSGAGILVTNDQNVIEGNSCTIGDRGIEIVGTQNFVTRNRCSGNANNWSVVAGNVCLVVQANNAGAISGNSGGVAPGSTDSNANFSY